MHRVGRTDLRPNATVYFLPANRPRHDRPRTLLPHRHLCLISGFDLLANPRVTIKEIIPAIPALGTIDPQLLARVQIDGAQFPIGFAIISDE